MAYTISPRLVDLTETHGKSSCAELRIPLANGGEVKVSASDLPLISGRSWFRKRCGRHYYAITYPEGGRGRVELMHRVLLRLARGDSRVVDHIDGDGLNNVRENIRVCTRGENAKNRGRKVWRAEFKGVQKQGASFTARIGAGSRYLGLYTTAVEAALAYNDAAPGAYGEFANLNAIPNESAARALLAQRVQLKSQIAEINRQLREWPCE